MPKTDHDVKFLCAASPQHANGKNLHGLSNPNLVNFSENLIQVNVRIGWMILLVPMIRIHRRGLGMFPLKKNPTLYHVRFPPLLNENAELLPVALRKHTDIPRAFYAYIVLSK
jgi:hypothetical protein